MKTLILRLAKFTGLFALSRYITRDKLRILAYHGVWMGDGHYGNFLYMSPKKFAERMQWLADKDITVLGLDEALNRLKSGTLPQRATVITIDDGWQSTYQHMWPELKRHHFPATLYVTTYYQQKQRPVFTVALNYLVSTSDCPSIALGKLIPGADSARFDTPLAREQVLNQLKRYAEGLDTDEQRQKLLGKLAELLERDWQRMLNEKWFHLVNDSELKAMYDSGLDIQLHTHRHRISTTDGYCISDELAENRAALSKITVDKTLSHFCYPSGVFEPAVFPMLEKAKVISATTTDIGLVDGNTPPFALPRILDGQAVSELEFEAEMSGFSELLRKLRGR